MKLQTHIKKLIRAQKACRAALDAMRADQNIGASVQTHEFYLRPFDNIQILVTEEDFEKISFLGRAESVEAIKDTESFLYWFNYEGARFCIASNRLVEEWSPEEGKAETEEGNA